MVILNYRADHNKRIIYSLRYTPELRSSPALVKQKAAHVLRMALYDQLCCIAGVSDLYTIGFDGVDVLGMKGFVQAQECEEEQNSFHNVYIIFLRHYLLFIRAFISAIACFKLKRSFI
jgi:hypothetical protein